MENIKLKPFKMKKMEKMRMDPNVGPPIVIVIGKRNTGKCLGKGTKIIMYDGNVKEVELITPGEQLMGPDSKCRIVHSVTTGRQLLYKIKQGIHGTDYVVNSSHIMTVCLKGVVTDIPIKKLLKEYEPNEYFGIKSGAIHFPNKKVPKPVPYTRGINYVLNDPVPDIIKLNSISVRRNFIYGVFDKHAIQTQTQLESPTEPTIYIFKKKINSDLKWVARSLGFEATENRIILNNNDSGSSQVTYPIEINIYKFGTYYGFELEPVPDRRFLLEDFTITHNTYLLKDIMYTMRNTPQGILMCKSSGGRESFAEVFPTTYIYPDVDLPLIDKIHKNQHTLREKYGSDLSKFDYSSILIMDDCSAGKTVRNSKEVDDLIFNGRHAKMMFLYSMHGAMILNPQQRGNLDFVFIASTPGVNDRRKIWAEWFSTIPKFTDFCTIMDNITENYGYLVFDNTAKSNKIQDRVFYYRARCPMPKYKFGSKGFWKVQHDQEKKEKKKKNGTVIIKKSNGETSSSGKKRKHKNKHKSGKKSSKSKSKSKS